jgi:S-methylmethionine-dependent homocysteine/selenocysteine methylase
MAASKTNLIFYDGFDLPYFAAFHLLRDREGRDTIVRHYERFIAIARAHDLGFILESPTWRASSDWGGCCAEKLGYTRDEIGVVNRRSVDLLP